MLHILILFVFSLAFSYFLFTRHRGRFTVNEFLLMQAITVVIAIGGYFLARHGSLQSIEHWNGRLTDKRSGSQKCCHCQNVCATCSESYTDSSGRSATRTVSCNCHEECDHLFGDYWWKLDVSTGDTITVKDCASSQSDEPEEWTKAHIGEAASVAHYYTNYLKADPESLLRRRGNPLVTQVPDFPKIYGAYKTDKVIGLNVPVPAAWQEGLRELNATIGNEKQIDVAIILTNMSDPTFADAIEERWLYGPKNAFIVVMGVTEDTITWARSVTLSHVEPLKIKVRNELPGMKLGDPAVITYLGEAVHQGFVRTPMAEYEYLASAATPSTGWLIALYLFHIAASIALALYFIHNRHTDGSGFSERPSSRLMGRRLTTFEPLSSFDNPDLRPGALLGRRGLRR